MNVVVNGLMTNYQKTGTGETLIFLHGWGDSSKTFAALVNELKDKYEIYVLDLPGFGGTQAPKKAWDLDDYAEFVNCFLSKLDIRPYALLGHSYGGSVAIILTEKSTTIQRLILLASAGIRNKNKFKKNVFTAGAKVTKVPLMVLPSRKRKLIKDKLYKSIGSDITVAPHMEETFRKMINQDVSESALKIKTPTLLIYGSSDTATPVSDGQKLSSLIQNSTLKVMDAGHFLHQEQPEIVANLIKDFLAK
jgi:pimeloyl-ACP methyl ester carboxylesterase